jgi:hypothetical protein
MKDIGPNTYLPVTRLCDPIGEKLRLLPHHMTDLSTALHFS